MHISNALRDDMIRSFENVIEGLKNHSHSAEKFAVAAYFSQGLLKEVYCVQPHLQEMVRVGYMPSEVLEGLTGAVAAAEGREIFSPVSRQGEAA